MENELILRIWTGDFSAKFFDGNYRNFNWNFANDFQETFKNFSSQLKKIFKFPTDSKKNFRILHEILDGI